MWIQKIVELSPRHRGIHLVTDELIAAIPELSQIRVGMFHALLQHTSASLSINENADPDVRADLEMAVDRIAPENWPYVHTCEGPDDMPAHIKAAFLGCSVSIPIREGRLCLGTWQGIYLGEHRNRAGRRRVVVTLAGEG
jgi:secondary thiamine-phosphate synthase enzyme